MRLGRMLPLLRAVPGLAGWGRSARVSWPSVALQVPRRALVTDSTASPPPPPPPQPNPSPSSYRRPDFAPPAANNNKKRYVDLPLWERFKRRPYFFLNIKGVAVVMMVVGSAFSFVNWVVGFYGRTRSTFAESKLMGQLEEAGADPAASFHLYMYSSIAHAVQDDESVTNHMGTLRFAPETMRMTPVPSLNEMAIAMNVYGTRRAGIINAVLRRSVDRNGLPVFTAIDLTVDSWDGRVFNVSMPPMHFSELVQEMQRRHKNTDERQTFVLHQ